jgi:formylglycine-generating enzyme required for sulfatase activity
MAFDRHDPDAAVPRPEDPERAVELFARLLESCDDPLHPDPARFDELLRRHPELRDELLLIRDGMEKFESIRRRLPRLEVVRSGRRWRWVGAWIAAAAVVALATFLFFAKDRTPFEHRAPTETTSTPRPTGDAELGDVKVQLVEAGIRYIEDAYRFAVEPAPTPAPDPVVLGLDDRRLDKVVNVLTAVEKIEELPRGGASADDVRRRERIRSLVSGAPARWQERVGDAFAQRDGSISDASPLLLALTRDPKLQTLLLAKQKEGALPQVLAELAAAAVAPARLTLKAIDLDHGAAELAGASVFAQAIDPVTGLLGTPIALGETPLEDRDLLTGDWRITVVEAAQAGAARHSELRLLAMPNEELAPRAAFFRATPDLGKSMALLPATSSRFGEPPDAKTHGMSHLPFATESVAEFWLDRNEVTCQEYSDFFLEAKAHPEWFGGTLPLHRPRVLASDGTCPARLARFPIVDVTWEEAEIYANWAGKRLPTEREWERAARGSLEEDRDYPWGDEYAPKGKHPVKFDASISYILEQSMPAGARMPDRIDLGHPEKTFVSLDGCDVDDPAYADGATPGPPEARLQRLGDNASEFVEDLYVEMRGDAPGLLRSASVARVYKGGNWQSIDPANSKNWSRGAFFPDCSTAMIGLRCAKTTNPFTASK